MRQAPDTPKNIKPNVSKHIHPNGIKLNTDFFTAYWGIWIILAILLITLAMKIIGHQPENTGIIENAEAKKAPDFGTPEYVGSLRCKDCHWEKYDTWKNTLHSKFMQAPDGRTILGDFERKNKLIVRVTDKSPRLAGKETTVTMFTRGGKHYVNAIGNDWQSHDYEISYVIGVGKRQNYLTEFPNGEIHVLPVEWDVKKQSWVNNGGLKDNYPGDGEFWGDQARIWQIKCGGCHVTGIKINYDKEKASFDTGWADMGIGCEACHGPGSNHVKAASEYFDHEKDNIVNPAKLTWRLKAMVCGQCHNWGTSIQTVSPHNEGLPHNYAYPYGFTAGEPLYLYYVEEKNEEKKHHQQYNEWSESEHAKAGVMCTNCHEVHQKEDVEFSMTKMIPDNLCMSCHTTLQRRAAHRIHTFGSCVSCHMPETKGHEHGHTFRFISPAESVLAGGVDKKQNSCNGCHHHKDTPPENLVEFLNAAKMADMPRPYSVHGK